ncbi:MAG: TetR/AcrR family transcriptional regulator [Ardenticatenaceae bacterium]|nr:TetR/AcrR family transcriptional regulator [Anaerolineales bacterium]MCB8939034.1 TetR/AcrR family transcriptional regulator [Ardenticatenaceae bacterium]MCB8974790.1 TetR/AcrR family transcriptional regulator [Ardenticatenaceae bacterium]
MNDKATQLIEASIDLFAQEGFWNTPTSRIAKHAGVATGTLFNYFASKDALIDAVYKQLKAEWLAHLLAGFPQAGTLKERVEHIWFRHIEWGLRFSVRYSLMMQLKLSNLVSQEVQQSQEAELAFAYDLIVEGIADGVLIDVDPAYLGQIFYVQMEAAVSYATEHNLADMPLTRHITQGFEIFWQGVTR